MDAKYPSRNEAFAEAREIKFPHWVPTVGPTGGRNIIDAFMLHVRAQLTLDATGPLSYLNVPRIFGRVRLDDIAGERVNLSGEALAEYVATHVGPLRFHYHENDIPASATTTLDFWLLLPTRKVWLYESRDFSLPADVFDAVSITCPGQADLDLGAGVTIDSATYFIQALTREEKGRITFYARDVLRETRMQTADEANIAAVGAYVPELIAYRPGDRASTKMGNWLAHRITPFQPERLRVVDYKSHYERDRLAASFGSDSDDPVKSDRVRVVWMTNGPGKITDAPYSGGDVTVRAENTDNDVRIVHRQVVPKSQVIRDRVARAYNVNPDKAGIATKKGTRIMPGQWGGAAPYMPAVVKL